MKNHPLEIWQKKKCLMAIENPHIHLIFEFFKILYQFLAKFWHPLNKRLIPTCTLDLGFNLSPSSKAT